MPPETRSQSEVLAQHHEPFAVLMQLRRYMLSNNLKFPSHKAGFSDRLERLREFRNMPVIIIMLILTTKGVDSIRKDGPMEPREPREPREQQSMDFSAVEPRTSIIAGDRG